MNIKIEEGKFCKTFSGDKIGPAEPIGGRFTWNIPWWIEGSPYFMPYSDDGTCILDNTQNKVVEECGKFEQQKCIYDQADQIMHSMSATAKRRAAFYLLGRFSLDLTERDIAHLQRIKEENAEGES